MYDQHDDFWECIVIKFVDNLNRSIFHVPQIHYGIILYYAWIAWYFLWQHLDKSREYFILEPFHDFSRNKECPNSYDTRWVPKCVMSSITWELQNNSQTTQMRRNFLSYRHWQIHLATIEHSMNSRIGLTNNKWNEQYIWLDVRLWNWPHTQTPHSEIKIKILELHCWHVQAWSITMFVLNVNIILNNNVNPNISPRHSKWIMFHDMWDIMLGLSKWDGCNAKLRVVALNMVDFDFTLRFMPINCKMRFIFPKARPLWLQLLVSVLSAPYFGLGSGQC